MTDLESSGPGQDKTMTASLPDSPTPPTSLQPSGGFFTPSGYLICNVSATVRGFRYGSYRIPQTIIHDFGTLSVFILAVMEEITLLIRGRTLGRTGRGRAIREQAGLSLRELARIVQVDAATLSRWERGDVRPRQAGAARWLTACDAIERELESSR
jgi:hypothetical protein